MTKNYIFRELVCGLSIEETVNLCFKSEKSVKNWDNGSKIPDECKRLMKMHSRLELSPKEEWNGFKMKNGLLEIPTGQKVTPQQILTGIALLEINSELEIQTSTHLLKTARAISNLKTG